MRLYPVFGYAADRRYPLAVIINVIAVVNILIAALGSYFVLVLLLHAPEWAGVLGGLFIGFSSGAVLLALGSLVEDVHDIRLHTAGYNVEEDPIDEQFPPEG
jgi:hypothetical protein